jgi:uncharacterized membrane protein YqjE
MSAPPPGSGLLTSLRRVVASGLEIAEVRLELLSTELEQEKLRLFDALMWAGIGLFLLAVGTVLAVGAVVLMFQEAYRLPALAVLSAVFIAVAAWLLRRARDLLRQPGGLFAGSVAELSRDRESLGPGDGNDRGA